MAARRVLKEGDIPLQRDGDVKLKVLCSQGTVCCSELSVEKRLDPIKSCCILPKEQELEHDKRNQVCLFENDSKVVTYTITVSNGAGNQLCFMTTATLANNTSSTIKNISVTADLYGSVNGTNTLLQSFPNQQRLMTSLSAGASATYPICACLTDIPDGLDLNTVNVTITVTYVSGTQPGSISKNSVVPIGGGTCATTSYYLYDANSSFSETDPNVHWQAVNFNGQPSVQYTVYQTVTASEENCGKKLTNTVQLVGLPNGTPAPGPNDPPPSVNNIVEQASDSITVNCASVELACNVSSDSGDTWSLTKLATRDCSSNDTIRYKLTATQLAVNGGSIRVSAKASVAPCTEDTVGCCKRIRYEKQFSYTITGFQTPCPTDGTTSSGGTQLENQQNNTIKLGCDTNWADIIQCLEQPTGGKPFQSILIELLAVPVTINLDCTQTQGSASIVVASCCQNLSVPEGCIVTLTDQLSANGQPLPAQDEGNGRCHLVSIVPTPGSTTTQDQLTALFGAGLTIDPTFTGLDYLVTVAGRCSCITNLATLTNKDSKKCSGQIITYSTSTDLSDGHDEEIEENKIENKEVVDGGNNRPNIRLRGTNPVRSLVRGVLPLNRPISSQLQAPVAVSSSPAPKTGCKTCGNKYKK